jgi:hypothetical protein
MAGLVAGPVANDPNVRPGRCRECLGAPKRCRAHDGCVLRGLHDTARSLNVQPVRGSNACHQHMHCLRATFSAGGIHIQGSTAIVNVFERNEGYPRVVLFCTAAAWC